MLSQNINLTTNKKPVTPVVHMVQNDSGRKLVCTVYDYTSVASGALSVELPSGTVYTATGTISSSTDHIAFSCDITNSMLAEVGKVKATVKLFNASSQLVSTHMLYIDVEESAGFNHPITPQNDKIYVVIDGQNIELAKQPQVDTLQTDVTNLKEDLKQVIRPSDDGNFYNENTVLLNTDIQTATGKLVASPNYKTSRPIYMDFSKPIYMSNVYGNYAYCYSESGYLGRVNIVTQNRYLTSIYPNVSYIRVLMTSSASNVFVGYWRSGDISYSTYNPISGWIDDYRTKNETKPLRVVSYNLGDFTGKNLTPNTLETAIKYRETISEFDADVCAFQYDVKLMNERDAYNYILQKFFLDGFHNGSRNYDYFSFCGKYPLVNQATTNYGAGTAYTHSYFEHCDIVIGNKPIHLVNLHFEWRDNSQRGQQITEILNHVANYDRCIILGDFNPENRINSEWVHGYPESTHVEDLQRFENAGFIPANGNLDFLGDINTIADEGAQNLHAPFDNILVKGNIKITSVGIVKKDYMNDHYPIICDLMVY